MDAATFWNWTLFHVFVGALLALDLFVLHRHSHVVRLREALTWSAVWIGLALLFNLGIYWQRGGQAALQFLTGYAIEKSLSVDNLFVFVMIFSFFRTPRECEHKVLFWGVVGALVMRAIFIFAGVALVERFSWLLYVFGGFLLFTGLKMLKKDDRPADLERNFFVRLARRCLPLTADYEGDRFWVRRGERWLATPLFLVLLVVESTDVIFAVDSIPAIMGVTTDPYLVYTSNAMAILGMRSLYFALAGVVGLFRFLHVGLAAVLMFVGGKLLLADVVHVPAGVSLGVVASLIAASVAVSWLWPRTVVPAGSSAAAPPDADAPASPAALPHRADSEALAATPSGAAAE